jgi:hypothetical protein
MKPNRSAYAVHEAIKATPVYPPAKPRARRPWWASFFKPRQTTGTVSQPDANASRLNVISQAAP